MSNRIKRAGVAAAVVAGVALGTVQQANATTSQYYVGKYPTYPRCAAAAQQAVSYWHGTGWGCVYDSSIRFWDAYVYVG